MRGLPEEAGRDGTKNYRGARCPRPVPSFARRTASPCGASPGNRARPPRSTGAPRARAPHFAQVPRCTRRRCPRTNRASGAGKTPSPPAARSSPRATRDETGEPATTGSLTCDGPHRCSRGEGRRPTTAPRKTRTAEKTVLIVVSVEQAPGLMAVNGVVGCVEVNHQLTRRPTVRGDELFDQGLLNRDRPLAARPRARPNIASRRSPAPCRVHTRSAPPRRGQAHRGR